eukprot:Skav220034  [mRNA]  locus=scaffold2981:165578:167006:+ [translate_table: standard]
MAPGETVPVVPQRERVFAFRDFVVQRFQPSALERAPVLDVAGGKGDLSWLLKNADGVDAIVVDPRVTDHTKITRTALWHYQMLGLILTRHEDVKELAASRGPQGPLRELDLHPPFRQPRHLRVYMDGAVDDQDLLNHCSCTEEWMPFWWVMPGQASQKAEETGPCGHHQSLELERTEGENAKLLQLGSGSVALTLQSLIQCISMHSTFVPIPFPQSGFSLLPGEHNTLRPFPFTYHFKPSTDHRYEPLSSIIIHYHPLSSILI